MSRPAQYRGEIWIIVENQDGIVGEVTFELIGRARPLADKLGGALAGVLMRANPDQESLDDLFARGLDKVYLAEDPSLAAFILETRSSILMKLVREYDPAIVLAAATTSGRSLMPHVSARLGTGLTADCTDLDIDAYDGALLQTRPAIGGNIMATIRTRERRPQMATVRPHSSPAAPRGRRAAGEIVRIAVDPPDVETRVRRLSVRPFQEETVALQDAEVIVSCGRGFKKRENLLLAESLAELIGASLGASREVVDRGWSTYPHQVGLSGKTVSPDLYIALGISGAVQHLAGIKTAKHIAAVNNDPDAPIFKIADFGVVCDIFELIPLLTEKLAARMGGSR